MQHRRAGRAFVSESWYPALVSRLRPLKEDANRENFTNVHAHFGLASLRQDLAHQPT